MKAIIIGNHAAGLSAAETLRQGDQSCDIIVISKEDVPPYSRCLIPYLVSGKKQVDDILFKPADFYRENSLETMFNVEAVKVLPKEKQVLLADGSKIGYDSLVIATGGTPSLPGIPGIKNEGVFGFHTLSDAEKIIAYADKVNTAVILGGGLIGIKAAISLKERGKNVKVLVSSPSILSQIVDTKEAGIFEEFLSELGMEILKNTSPARVLGEEKVEGLETTEGKKIQCEMVVVGKGVKANKDLVRGTDIKTEYGIIVDEHCRTSVPTVYAAGDVTQSQDTVRKERWTNALWPFAVEEGRVAAENILGNESSVLRERTSMNSIAVGDIALISCGLTGVRDKVDGGEELTVKGPGKWDCKRFVLKDGKLVGYVLVGNVAHAGVLTSLVRKEIGVESIKQQLLLSKYDFASILPLVKQNRNRFTEREYREVLAFF